MADPTWEDDIKKYFTQLDIGCMRSRTRPLDLSDYQNVKDKADDILRQLQRRRDAKPEEGDVGMPKGGKAWEQDKIDRFKSWKDAGCPRGGTT